MALVAGIRGPGRRGATQTEQARIVIGADGGHSLIARLTRAPEYNPHPRCTYCHYSYWEGVDPTGLVFPGLYVRGRVGAGAAPTNGELCSIFAFGPREQFHSFRSLIDGNLVRTLDYVNPLLAERLRAAKRVERYYGTATSQVFSESYMARAGL